MKNYVPYENGKIKITFLFQAASVWSSWESFYLSCMDDNRIEVTLVLLDEVTVAKSQMKSAKEYLEANRIKYILFKDIDIEQYKPHVVLLQFPYDVSYRSPKALSLWFVSKGIRVVYIPYGIEISDTIIARKDHFHNFVVDNAWRVYASSQMLLPEYKKYCRNRKAVKSFGSPKFDAIIEKDKFILDKYLLDRIDGRRIVVWKMHFPKIQYENGIKYQITPELDEYILFAKSMEQYKDIFFLILPHPKMLHGMAASDIKGDFDLELNMKRLLDEISKQDNAYIDTNDDYRISLYHADAIIIDRSALLVEAAMMDVPVLFMKNDKYEEKFTKPVHQIVKSFLQGKKCCDMDSFIRKFVEDTILWKDRKDIIMQTFPYIDGNCGYNIKEDIVKEIEIPDSKKKKILFFGCGDVCEYYLKKQEWCRQLDFEIVAIADSNNEMWGTKFFDWVIINPRQIIDIDWDVLVIMTEQHYFEIKKHLVYDLYIDEKSICRLDEFVINLNQ